ncbi:MAG: hypothetical protein ABSG86_19775 [Thermoguttaceae bacterium]
MRSDLPRLTPGAVVCLLLGCAAVWAQESPAARPDVAKPVPTATTPGVVPGPPANGGVEEAWPSIIYEKDTQGKLQPVINLKPGEFEELVKKAYQPSEDARPRCSLQQMSANGSVVGDYAELSIQFRILVREDQWTRVPLRLDQGILREPAQYQGSGEQFLQFEGGGAGYVAWVRGPAGQQHQVTLKVLVPLVAAGEVTRLHLLVPRATASELRLKVPLAGAVAKVSEGATLRTPNSSKNETELTVVGLGGDFELSWHRPEARVAETPAVLEVQGILAARLDNRGVDAEATLTVRSYGRLFDSFRVRLPQDADLVPGTPNGYTAAVVDGAAPSGSRQRVVEVRLPKPTSGPVEVHLASNRATDPTKPGPGLELAGFEVLGATRQWGTVAVSVVGDWQVLWGPSAGVQQTDQVPEAVRRRDVVAAFDYFTQPCSLLARLVPRKTRIGVEPEYVLSVDGEAVRLDAKLRYTVRGGKVFALDVLMPDWQIDEVGPDSLVAVDGVPKGTPGGALSIPLVQPSSGQFEVRLRAHRSLGAQAKSLVVPLPQPQATAPASVTLVVLPAVLVVLPADNIELIPGGEATTGLFRQQGAIPIELPPRQQEPLFYRSEAKAVFAAEIRRHVRQISVDVASQADLDAQGGRVEQKLAYMVSYEPTDHLMLEVPRNLAESGRMELKCDGQATTPVALGEGADDASKPVRMRVALPKPTIGLCELLIRYRLAPHKLSAENRAVVSVPLVMPEEGDLLSNRLSVTAAAELHVQPRPGAWTPVEAGMPPPSGYPAERRGLQLAASGRPGQVELEVEGQSGGQPDVVVDRAWLQTWLTREARQDRAVFQFTSRRREFELTLPAGTAVDQLDVALDGKRLSATVASDNTLVLPLAGDGRAPGEARVPGEAGWGRHTVEVRYHLTDPRPPRGAMTLALAHPRSDAWVRQMYWQLVLPRDEHVVLSPHNFTNETSWGWTGFYWGRQPLLDQAQLEDWVGLPHAERGLAAGGVNDYLFSTLGTVEVAELRTASRSMIVLAASGAALLAGLLLIYLPKTRHPASVLVATVALAAAAVWWPEPALLAAEAAVLGLVLALVAGLLSYTLGRRRQLLPWGEMPGSAVGSSVLSARTPHPAAAAPPAPPPAAPPSTSPPTPQSK